MSALAMRSYGARVVLELLWVRLRAQARAPWVGFQALPSALQRRHKLPVQRHPCPRDPDRRLPPARPPRRRRRAHPSSSSFRSWATSPRRFRRSLERREPPLRPIVPRPREQGAPPRRPRALASAAASPSRRTRRSHSAQAATRRGRSMRTRSTKRSIATAAAKQRPQASPGRSAAPATPAPKRPAPSIHRQLLAALGVEVVALHAPDVAAVAGASEDERAVGLPGAAEEGVAGADLL